VSTSWGAERLPFFFTVVQPLATCCRAADSSPAIALGQADITLNYSFIKDENPHFLFKLPEAMLWQENTPTVDHIVEEPGEDLLNERRTAKRFDVDWPIRMERADVGSVIEGGLLRNLSSGGALLSVSSPLKIGNQLDVYIKLPRGEENWMKFRARVVRISPGIAAIQFATARPEFSTPPEPR
jgi:hypothetical protein